MIRKEKIVETICLRPNAENIDRELIYDMVEDSINDLREMLHYDENEDLPSSFSSTIKNSVLAAINKFGAEGLNSQSFSGISFSFQDNLSEIDLKKIRSKRRFP